MKFSLFVIVCILIGTHSYANVAPSLARSFCGRTQNPSGAIRDGLSGLAYAFGDPKPTQIAGMFVSSCIEYTFGSPVSGVSMLYRHTKREIADDSCESSGCGTHPGFLVFSKNGRRWQRLSFPSLPLAEKYVRWPVKGTQKFRSLLVCRGGGGPFRDNIQIRSIIGF